MYVCVYLRFWGELSVLIKILPATKVQGGDMAHWPKCSWLDRVYHHNNVTELQCPSALNHYTYDFHYVSSEAHWACYRISVAQYSIEGRK